MLRWEKLIIIIKDILGVIMKRLLIIETIPDKNKAYEGNALKESLEAMKKSWDARTTKFLIIDIEKAFTKKRFFELLNEETDYLHISAHGERINRSNNFFFNNW
jgi:hypothetical protein